MLDPVELNKYAFDDAMYDEVADRLQSMSPWGREDEIQPVQLNQRHEVDANPFAQGSAYEEATQAPPAEEHLDAHQWDLEPVPFLEPMPVPLVPLPEEEPSISDRDPDNHENSEELEEQVPEDQAQHDLNDP